MPLIQMSPGSLRTAVQELPEGTPEVLDAGQLLALYRTATGEPSAAFDSLADAHSFQGLVDLTRAHLRRMQDEASVETSPATGRRGKPSRAIPAEKWKVSIRQDLALFVDMMLFDPARDRLGYGERSTLIEQLVLAWARERGFKG